MADASSAQPNFLIAVGGEPTMATAFPDAGELAGTVVVAADSGLDRALAAGLVVDHVVGDLDSVSDAALAQAAAAGANIHRHEADKDATDLELAVELVVDLAASGDASAPGGLRPVEDPADPGGPVARVGLLVVGPGGGRLDHQVADLLALSGPSLAGLDVTARFGPATVTVVRPGRPGHLAGRPHEQVSLLPMHGAASGVTTSGLRWALVDADLVTGTTRAMSNEFVGPTAVVAITGGVLLVVQPATVAARIAERTTTYDPTPRSPDRSPERRSDP
ncbi:MAG: thiamine pyrophosphokinae [Acidimicrobiales bacterium]|nr:thiamine pyrophosphokinae [Acidimicrobiales bacterium]